MLDGLRAAAAWDPIGLANEEPTSVTDRLRAELKELRAGVRQVVEDNHGMPMEKPNDAKGLLGCLNEFLSDQKDEAYERTREISSLRHTIAMLQAERRKSLQQQSQAPAMAADAPAASDAPAADAPAADPPAADPPPTTAFSRLAAMTAAPIAAAPSPPPATEEPKLAAVGSNTSRSARSPEIIERETAARVSAAAESAASAARSDERARSAEKLAASCKELDARHALALNAEKEAGRLKLGALSRTLGRESEAERAAISECLSRALAELESRVRSQAESHAQALQQTKQRAAQMLAKKDAALLVARQARMTAESAAEGGQQGAPAKQQQHAPGKAAGSAASPRQVQSVGVGTSDDEGSRFLAVGNGSDDVASRFARRVAELEIALDQSREDNRALEGGRLEDEKRKRVLRARVARHEKAWTSGTDMEYLRNVLLQWFTMPPSGQQARGIRRAVLASRPKGCRVGNAASLAAHSLMPLLQCLCAALLP